MCDSFIYFMSHILKYCKVVCYHTASQIRLGWGFTQFGKRKHSPETRQNQGKSCFPHAQWRGRTRDSGVEPIPIAFEGPGAVSGASGFSHSFYRGEHSPPHPVRGDATVPTSLDRPSRFTEDDPGRFGHVPSVSTFCLRSTITKARGCALTISLCGW